MATLLAANPFAGRWALQSDTASGSRVFWLEVRDGAQTIGSFFGATGGRLASIRDAQLINGELRFVVERRYDGTPPRVVRAFTRAWMNGPGLKGSTEIDDTLYRWTGWRSPEIPDRDDGSWKEGTPLGLLRSGLPALTTAVHGRLSEWQFNGVVLRNVTPRANLLVTRDKFWNFKLHVEYKLPPKGNSGIGLRHHYELQLADDHGEPPDVHGNVSLYSRIAPHVNASRPANQWQKLDLRLVGRDLSVVLNGRNVIDRARIEGLCGLALDPWEERPGPIALQGDHGPVEFRNVVVTPLVRR